MIEDLKADSARWEQERRQQSARSSSGGTTAKRDANGAYIGGSNSPAVQYRNSDTHQSRQYYGPTEGSYPDGVRDPFDPTPRYPGTGTGAYTGAAGSYAPQPYGNQGGYIPQQGYAATQQQFAPPVGDVSYSQSAAMPPSGFAPSRTPPYTRVDTNLNVRDYPANEAAYPSGVRERIPVATTTSQSRPTYMTSGSSQQGFPAGYGPAYSPSNPAVPPASSFAPVQPRDPFFGRGAYSKGFRVENERIRV